MVERQEGLLDEVTVRGTSRYLPTLWAREGTTRQRVSADDSRHEGAKVVDQGRHETPAERQRDNPELADCRQDSEREDEEKDETTSI